MNPNYKLTVGIAIGLAAALGIGFIAFKAGQISSTADLDPILAPQSSLTTIEQIKVTGTFQEEIQDIFPNSLVFTTSTAVSNLPKGTDVYFVNYDSANSLLKINQAGKLGKPGCDYISGNAEIIISDFKPQDTTIEESVNTAKLVSVIKIITPAQCGRGSGN